MATLKYEINCVASLPMMAAIEAKLEALDERVIQASLRGSVRPLWRVAVDMLRLA